MKDLLMRAVAEETKVRFASVVAKRLKQRERDWDDIAGVTEDETLAAEAVGVAGAYSNAINILLEDLGSEQVDRIKKELA